MYAPSAIASCQPRLKHNSAPSLSHHALPIRALCRSAPRSAVHCPHSLPTPQALQRQRAQPRRRGLLLASEWRVWPQSRPWRRPFSPPPAACCSPPSWRSPSRPPRPMPPSPTTTAPSSSTAAAASSSPAPSTTREARPRYAAHPRGHPPWPHLASRAQMPTAVTATTD